jgi:Protein of unknown function (DUF1488)
MTIVGAWDTAAPSAGRQIKRSRAAKSGDMSSIAWQCCFSMMDGAREIPCAVSASAMDEIEHVSRTASDQREQQFLRLRDRIEQCASRKFLAHEFEGNPAGIILRSIDFRK